MVDGKLLVQIGDFALELDLEAAYEHQRAYNGWRSEPSHPECCVVYDLDAREAGVRRAPRVQLVKEADALQRLSVALWDYINANPDRLARLSEACLDHHRARQEDRRLASTGI